MSEERRLLALAMVDGAMLDSAQRAVLEAAMNEARQITHAARTDGAIIDTFRDALLAGLAGLGGAETEVLSTSCADEKESHNVNGFCRHCSDGWL